MEKLITVLTATFNRAHLLPDLYQSLCRQTCKDFNWVIVDDGSQDETKQIVCEWLQKDNGFQIAYIPIPNGGKNRAVNLGVKHASTPFIMIVDSDDYLTDDAIEFLAERLADVSKDDSLAGISALKGKDKSSPLSIGAFGDKDYIIANNLERKKYGLDKDACEVYRTDLLRSHPFKVWEDEKFVPEEIVWNQLALEGYSLRWYNKVTYVARYQEEGLTKGSWNLLKTNPMGYAMMYKQRVELSKDSHERFSNNVQLIAQSLLGGHPTFAFKNNWNLHSLLAFPVGCMIAARRIFQYRHET